MVDDINNDIKLQRINTIHFINFHNPKVIKLFYQGKRFIK